ncbi:MAG: thioredoxin [Theionarchaea archaeon]|nr:thioredoxin [Theionarchaea archaeon]MBU7001074.1 thioredoxin [Theionarchaea archaeon]MBU7020563.1 thioredoxin [Theionarchaea archaeon]MBU7034170.1 thioredoxin [Theionarchaea archaeon]MBU7039286.1 thioredoxin [Theionarchaea archaeon]
MEITDRVFEKEVLSADVPVLVDFWASWCLPCKAIEETLKELEGEYRGKVKICKLNVDRNKFTAQKYNISGLPTFIFFKNGEPVFREVAAKSKKELQDMIEKTCFTSGDHSVG